MTLLERYEWKTLDHPAYSADKSSCNFDLFPKLKEDMRGIRYNDLEEFESAVASRVRVLENGCLATGIGYLPKRWKTKGKRKVQGVLQSQTAALPRPQEEEETDKSKQAQSVIDHKGYYFEGM